ncbi:deoxyribodipyrimidine photo-lyase [Bermanella marisrubri]|uniref:Putative deoxyribodipyrimidine photolyase n=1 Tax=Bermanella marisrubri TaxID=207949 RepID=Q1MZA6_9GAMM|nr:deoxyribodipyrimidine photo-lyase [Bermanella marisrubri]EAT11360.1 putative deoxyribodipyrimidine photolyase [Oceanobacter sp. RED65] [Bermanella marisrubri]QIZ85254.1 deoxyribodipyrimidine photo-lyase [Bermanella marisrubri]
MNVVWFKRDLRLHDHDALFKAISLGKPCLLLYILEPSLIEDTHYDDRHWRFVYESLQDLNKQLSPYGHRLTVIKGEALDVLQAIHQRHEIHTIFSHQEIGIARTFSRDRKIEYWCKNNSIVWQQSPHGAVVRGLQHRLYWQDHWYNYMARSIPPIELNKLKSEQSCLHDVDAFDDIYKQTNPHFQYGGESSAMVTLEDFLTDRHLHYRGSISSPSRSRHYCSRLSPYLAWGNLSLRYCYQQTQLAFAQSKGKQHLNAFSSRLHWHCHFIQKFESESRMEFEAVNRGYLDFPYDIGDSAHEKLAIWQQGKTGYPLVDACIRCLQTTGYLNFRMRAMLVSFACHYLNLHWKSVAEYLAKLFLDFDPGIHYSQIQMQAGITGTNTIRIYNPVKQSQEQDPEGEFIRLWCPELSSLSNDVIHSPWLLGPLEKQMFALDYPEPMVNADCIQINRERLWSWRSRDKVKLEAKRILNTHVTPNSETRQQAKR